MFRQELVVFEIYYVLMELLYNNSMEIKKKIVTVVLGTVIVLSSCGYPIDKMFERHGPIVLNECYEDGSCRIEFEDGFFLTDCVQPKNGCH